MQVQTGSIQSFISNVIVSELSGKLHTKVSIGKIQYKFFNDIAIQNLYVEDQQKDTLVFIGQADAHFKFWKFFQGKIIFTSIELDHLFGNLVINKAGHSNLDFVIKAFKKPPTNDSTQIEYRISHFKIKNSRFNYSNYKEFKKLSAGVFNANKLKVKNINADVAFNIFKKDSMDARILSLSAEEQSGLILTNFKTRIFASAKAIKIPFVDLRMPNSRVHLEDIRLRYDSLADLKHFNNRVKWNAPITSTVALSDLRAFVPDFKNVKGVATFKGLITGRLSSLRFQKMEIKYGNHFLLNADLDVNGLPNLSEAFIYGQIKELRCEKGDVQDLISELTQKPFLLPNEVTQLGMVRYKGNISGFLNNLVLYGNINTNVGDISTDILLKFANDLRDLTYNGTIKTQNFRLGKLLSNKQLGNVSFNLNTIGFKKENTKLQGVIKAKVSEIQFNGYAYRDVQFNGKYDGKGYDGAIDFQDQNVDAHFIGKIDLTQKLPVYDFGLKVNNINLNALKLTDKYPGATLSFNGKTNIVGNSLDNINGYIRFDSIEFKNQNKTLNVDKIQFVSRIEKDLCQFTVSSDYVNGSFSGNFKYSTVGQTIDKIVQKYLPSLATLNKSSIQKSENHIDIDLQIANTAEISNVLDLSYTLDGVSTIKGSIDEKSNKIDVSASFPLLKSNKRQIENISLHVENLNKELQFSSRAQMQEKDGLMNVFLKASAAKDSLKTQLGWQNIQQITNAGEIQSVTKFSNINGKTAAELSVLPTQVIISDSVWNIHPCKIDFKADSTIQIHNFVFDSNNKQFIHINGIASKNQNDSLNLSMNKLDLDFVMGLLKLRGFSISGMVTGRATLLSVLQQPIFEANLGVQDLKLNHVLVGNGKITSNWDKLNSLLLAHGTFVNNKSDTLVVANCLFNPKADTISVLYDARNFSIEFLSPYFESVVQNVKGYATGKIRMFGPLKHGLSFEGDAFVDKGQASMKMFKTTYFLNDSVHLTKNAIELRHVKVLDQERNPASLNATLTHDGFFKHMKFDVNIAGKNILALNTQAEDNDYFFGKAYANGKVHIYGDEKVANIDVNAISQPQTKCYIQMGGAAKTSDNSFIHFVNKNASNIRKENNIVRKSDPSEMNVKVNLKIDVTPDAEMELIIDSKAGDRIRGNGSGSLQISFDTFSDMKLYGTYTINSGYYLFTLQNLIRKEFKIDQGSTLTWTGSPYSAKGDIRALYSLTASLKDLDETTLSATTTRSSIPVNCVLKLSDNIMKPTINFDIDLPQSDEGVKQRVRNIINTDEMMNRQILYLLVFNKFYTPDYMRNTTLATNLGANQGISFLTSTASAQLNNWISQTFKSNNLSLGFDYQATDAATSDIQAQIFYQPNNRLIINGNLGYRNDNIVNNTNRFIGDVDFQWLLTEAGKLRFKAYNHTVDRYTLSRATQTQGVGFIYKEDFNSMSELFSYYLHFFVGNKKNKTNEKTTSSQK